MHQGKPVNFSVIKEKIIKTDEVLHRYMETNNKLKSVQETCKAIKLKYDQTALNLSRLQLENERCTFNSENLKLKCELLEKENEKLREHSLTLEDKYNHQTIQSQLNIKELEDQLRMIQEIKTTAESLSPKKRRSLSSINENDKKIRELEDKIKQLEESEINTKNEVISLNVQNEKLSNDITIIEKKHSDTVKKLQNENINLLEELNTFKCQVNNTNSNLELESKYEAALENLNKEKDIEISELRKKIFTFIEDENKFKIIKEENETLKQKLMDQEINLTNAKKNNCTKDICLQTDEVKKMHTRSIRSQTLESMKTLSQHNLISTENRKLKQSILDRDAEIYKLKAKPKISTIHCHTQTNILDIESVDDILAEMCIPFSMLSPMSNSSENLNLDGMVSPILGDINDSCSVQSDIPEIVITPPTPIIEKNFEKLTDFDQTSCALPVNNENISSIEELQITNTDNLKNSEVVEDTGVKANLRKVPRRKSLISDNFVKLRKSSLKRLLNKRYVFKKEMRRVRKLSKQDCILKALLTLKHSNINFTISNDSNIPKWWNNYSSYDSFKYPDVLSDINQKTMNSVRKASISTQKYKNTQYITEKLNCSSKSCTNGNSCMLLNNVQGITELLGFFNVKNENNTPSNSRMGNVTDDNHLIKSLNLTGGGEITPENLLETLADLVSQKLREKKKFSKRKQKSVSHKSDSFFSETETEIERLFATPDDSVLKRNKMLLKKAKQQNLKESVPAPSEDNINSRKYTVTDDGITPVAYACEASQRSETEINSLERDDVSCIENKNVSNTTDLNPAIECTKNSSCTLKYSRCCSGIDENMVKSPSAKSAKNFLSGCTESTKRNDKLENHGDGKMFAAPTNHMVFNERAESCDFFQYSDCPEIISPLSSVIDKDSPRSKSKHRSLNTEENRLQEYENKEMSPLSSKSLKFSNRQNLPDLLNAPQINNDELLIESSMYDINKDKLLSEQINHFEERNNSIEGRTTPNSHRKLLTSNIKRNKNDCCDFSPKKGSLGNHELANKQEESLKGRQDFVKDNFEMEINELGNAAPHISPPSVSANYSLNTNEIIERNVVEVNQSISSIKNQRDDLLVTTCLSLKENQEKHPNVSDKAEENSVTTKSNEVTDSNNRNSREFVEYEQFEHDISFGDPIFQSQCELSSSPIRNITKEILNVLPDEKNTSNNSAELNEVEDIPSCPQSPISNYEEVVNTNIPKIIPLNRLFEQNHIIGLDENSTESTLTSHVFFKQEERVEVSKTKIISSNNHNEHLEQVIADALPNVENTSSCLTDISEIEDIKIKDIPSCPQSPVSDYEEYIDIKIPKIIPLKRLFEQDPMIGLDEYGTDANMPTSHVFFEPEERVEASKTKVISSNNQNEQLEQAKVDALPREKSTSSCLSKTNEIEKIKNEDIPSCPQSPTIDYEEYVDIKIPKIIPLNRYVESDPIIGSDENSTENTPTSNRNLNEQLEQVLLEALSKEKNTSSHLSKPNETENIKIEDIPGCPQSPVSDCEKHMDIKSPKIISLKKLSEQDAMTIGLNENSDFSKQQEKIETSKTNSMSSNNNHNKHLEQKVVDTLLKEENTSSHSPKINEIETVKIENIPSCPQSPINNHEEHMDVKIPKIIPLKQLFEQHSIIGLHENGTDNIPSSHNFSKHEQRIEASKPNTISSNNYNKQFELDVLPMEENNSSHLSETNETETIESCPASPIKKKVDKRVNTDNVSIHSLSPVSNDEGDKYIPIPSLNKDRKSRVKKNAFVLTDNEECLSTKSSKTIENASPKTLRRSKRVCKRISYSELLNGSSSESCETDSISEQRAGNSKISYVSKIPQVDPNSCAKSQFSDKSASECPSIVTEISRPIKRKRGRPRKHQIVECNREDTKVLSIDEINYNEESLHPVKLYHGKHPENTVSCIEPEEKISKNTNKELPQEENSITDLCIESLEENVKSNIFVSEPNSELKSTNYNEESLHTEKPYEKHLENTVLCVEPEEKISSKDKNEELSQEENSVTDLYIEPVEKKLKSNMVLDESNFELKSTNCIKEPLCPEKPHGKHLENTILYVEPEEKISKDKNKELVPEENSITDFCIEHVEESIKPNIVDYCQLKLDVVSENTSNVPEENIVTKLWEKQELHNELLTDTYSQENIMEYNVTKEEQNKVKKRKSRKLKLSDTVISMASEEKRISTNNYWKTNEFHNDLIINETNSKQISDESIGKAEKLDNKDSVDPDVLRQISDIISEEKRKINLFERNMADSDPFIVGTNTEEVSDNNSEKKEKFPSKSIVRKKKFISTLKSNVIKQFKMKRKMFQMDVDTIKKANACDVKINHNSNRNNIKTVNVNVGSYSKLNTAQGSNISESTNVDNNESNSDDKRIHIVQNFLIPANSCYAVDLMEQNKCKDSKSPLSCDIRLDVNQTSSQSEVKFCKPPIHKKKITDSTNDSNIPIKKKRRMSKSRNDNSDILSKILGEMDKDKPNNTVKNVTTPSIRPQAVATSIEDKEWRKGIMVIAESMYNVSMGKGSFKRPTKPYNPTPNHPKKKPSTKHRILVSRLTKLSTEDKIPDEIIVEFKRQSVDDIAGIILQRLSQDTTDKPEGPSYPAPLMTKTQRILLALMVRLENENVPNVLNTFLSKVDTLFFLTGCGIRTMIPITRLYSAVCRLQADIDKMRNFCCDAFYFMGDLAIPLLFTVLTSWLEVIPKEPDLKYYPLAKVLVQIVHLKGCKTSGYNFLPLRSLLHQYHEYPTERWNCDELFAELYQQYLRNPVKSVGIQLLCKNKDIEWTYKKVNEFLKPLVYKIPADNVNFKATVIVLIGDICSQCKPKNKSDQAFFKDLQWWLNGLIEGEESQLIEKSVDYSLTKLRKKHTFLKDNSMKIVDKMKNRENDHEEFEKRENDK